MSEQLEIGTAETAMIRLARNVAFLLAALASPLTAQWWADGEPLPDAPWKKSDGDFAAMIVLTSKSEEFLEAWNHQPSPDYVPEIETTDRVGRGVPIVAFIVFSGCRSDPKGNCDSTTDFQVLRPDGTEYASIPDQELWKGEAPAEGRVLLLGTAYLAVIVEPEDPLGEYTFQARVCDRLAYKCLELSQTFVAEEGEE